jgi:hypothetical protein
MVTMSRRLLVVSQRFWLRGRGLILSPGMVPVEGERIMVGDRVSLIRPDGTTRDATIRGTSTYPDPASTTKVDLLLDVVSKEEVPIGTEVWSVGL